MNAEKEKDWLEIFNLIDEEEIEKAVNKVYLIKVTTIKDSGRKVIYCEGM